MGLFSKGEKPKKWKPLMSYDTILIYDKYVKLIGLSGTTQVQRSNIEAITMERTAFGKSKLNFIGKGTVHTSFAMASNYALSAQTWLITELGL